MNEYDVIIVGGGITGAGTARDCALRGLRVLLINILLAMMPSNTKVKDKNDPDWYLDHLEYDSEEDRSSLRG